MVALFDMACEQRCDCDDVGTGNIGQRNNDAEYSSAVCGIRCMR